MPSFVFPSQVGLLTVLVLLPCAVARASGSPERIVEILTHPSDPDVIVARYGRPGNAKGSGLLFSSDGGKTFRASCADFIKKDISLNSSDSIYQSRIHMDGTGHLYASGLIDELFVGDASGCTFEHEPSFEHRCPASFAADPADASATYAFVCRGKASEAERARSYVLRRDGAGAWSEVAEVHHTRTANEAVFANSLITTMSPSGTLRIAVYYSVFSYETNRDRLFVGVSEDGGRTFAQHPLVRSDDEAPFRLLGFDPAEPGRIIALDFDTGRKDRLLLSDDGGATFSTWAEVDTFTGMAFGEGGKIYVASTADSLPGSEGGLFVADRVGDPLAKVRDSSDLDCIHYRPSDRQLFACQLEKLGTLDGLTGAFTPLSRMLAVESLISCGERDAASVCEDQLTAGASWCCVGHYPWTPFCGQYDKSMPICGRSAREYLCDEVGICAADETPDGGSSVESDGAIPNRTRDGGGMSRDAAARTPDAGRASAGADADADASESDPPRRRAADGCSLVHAYSACDWLFPLTLLGSAVVVRRRRVRH